MTEVIQRLPHDSLVHSAARVPQKTALVVDGRKHSYEELLSAAQSLAGTLQQRGLQRGDRVAIYMDNTWPAAVAIFGTLLAGGVFLVINPQTKSDKLAYILDDSGASFLLTAGQQARFFLPAVSSSKQLRGVICAGRLPESDASSGPPIESFEEVIASGEGLARNPGVIPLDLAALIYTSGSTGNPKGVMMTHQSTVFITGSLIEYLRLSEEHRILNVLPMAFDYGLYQLFMAVRLGATLVLERSFTYPAQVLERVKEHEVTVFPGVPTIYAMLLSMHEKKALSFPSVQRVTNTGAALAADLIPKLREIFPNALIYKMYGLTETKRTCYLEPELLDKKANSVGKAIPGTEVFLLSEDGKPVPPGEVGILHVRGPHVMLGYWNQPERTAKMLRDGPLPGQKFLCTHDYFRMDEEGFFYFVGRSDDIIKSRGEKVSPVEVENALQGIDGISEAAVIGVPDELLGEAIRAFVTLEGGSTLTEQDVKRISLSRLENFMAPKEVIFLDELPKTPNGKISKKALAKMEVG
jgi:amino acid adenylation domain-containing protein